MSTAPFTAIATPAARKLGPRSRWSFGLGSIAYGIKDNGFATFLLLFYNQVIGLPDLYVGVAIAAALMVEAFIDPAVGFWSDRTRSRWGRRHPWMYASALPVAVGWIMLWNPPAVSQGFTLVWLFGSALLVRIALSAFEIPSSALGPELSSDYDERTKLFSYRYLFGWIGGLGMLSLAYAVFLRTGGKVDLLSGVGYSHMALFAAIVMAAAILISSIGLHHEIEHLPKIVPTEGHLTDHFREFRQTVSNRGFAVLMVAGLFAYTGQGISFALSNYMYQYVWRFEGGDYQYLSGALLLGAVIAFVIAPWLTRGGDKHRVGAAFAFGNALLVVLPYVLRLAGWFPANGSPYLLPILLTLFVVNTACGVGAFILGAAMMSDVVEESEARTGRRSEGVFFAGSFFVQKMVGGLGIFMASMILWFAAFPAAAKPGQVPAAVIDRLTIVFIVLMLTFYTLAAITYSRFPFGRKEHEARLARAGAG